MSTGTLESSTANADPAVVTVVLVRPPRFRGQCRSGEDGDCEWEGCPQLRDGEPEKTGRSCPLYPWHHSDGE